MIDLAIPYDEKGGLPPALKGHLVAIEQHIKVLKGFAVKINVGKANEEDTIKAKWHKCFHDETPNTPCAPEVEI